MTQIYEKRQFAALATAEYWRGFWAWRRAPLGRENSVYWIGGAGLMRFDLNAAAGKLS